MDIYTRWLLYAALFGVVVIVIWVAQLINKRKSEKRRIIMKKGPKVERFVDPGKAAKPEYLYTQDESKIKAKQWWERSGLSEGICGVCNGKIKSPEGNLVSQAMVAKSERYLDIAAKPIMEFGQPRDKAVAQVKEQILSGKTPWLVCDKCSRLFFGN